MFGSHRNKLLVFTTIEIILCQSFATRHFLQKYVPKINVLIDHHSIEEKYYPVINVFVDKKVKNEWSTLIISSYAKRIPTVLFNTDERLEELRYPKGTKFHYIVGIFEYTKDLNLNQWREAVGERWTSRGKFVVWLVGRIYYQSHCQINQRYLTKGLVSSRYLRRCYITDVTHDYKKELFEEFWIIGESANVALINFNSTSEDFELSAYDIFRPDPNGGRGVVYLIPKEEKMFPEKFTNLYGHPIHISMFQSPNVMLKNNNTEMNSGEDVEFFWLLQSHMNFSIIVSSSNCSAAEYATVLPNGESVGLIGDILLNRSEVLGNSRFIHTIFERDLECLYPFDYTSFNAIVPYQQPVLRLNLIGQNLFKYRTIMNIAPIFLLTIYMFVKKERYPIFNTWNVIIKMQFRKIGKKSSDRIVKIMWIVYALILSCVFEVRLIQLLTNPYKQVQINTLTHLNSTNLTIMVGDKMLDPITKSSLPLMQDLAKKSVINLNFTICSERLINHGDVACASDKLSSLVTLAELWCLNNKTYKVHLMREPIGEFWLVYVLKKNSPYLDRFDNIQRKILEAALKMRISKNNENSAWRNLLMKRIKYRHVNIKMWHLKSTFMLCLSLMGLAFLVFFQELYCGKKRIELRNRYNKRLVTK